jgi:exopolyphosphatase/guanosine-5'-triphosphate,3'-diphosphate pyrophosphatase
MRAAAIDVGSNTLRLLIGDIHGNTLSRVHADRAVTRLAEGIRDTGVLGQENMRKSLSVLKDFARLVEKYGAARVEAVGTSALRDAGNSREFLDTVLQDAGIAIKIISGIREAELTVKGILMGVKEKNDASLIIDIGGGSTEWILHKSHGSPFCGSLRLGVVDLFERFIRKDPPSQADIASLNDEVDAHLLPLKQALAEKACPVKNLIGTGGTITTLASMDLCLEKYDGEKVHMHTIPLRRLSLLRDTLVSLPLNRRREMRGLEPERADLIIPGIVLTIRLMDSFGFPEVTVSDYGLLEGLIKEMNDGNGV